MSNYSTGYSSKSYVFGNKRNHIEFMVFYFLKWIFILGFQVKYCSSIVRKVVDNAIKI